MAKTKTTTIPLSPFPGYILCQMFVPKGPFESALESEGEDQLSTVLAVGEPSLDDQGEERFTDAKVGDIIAHAASNKTIKVKHTDYRFVHFTEVHGKYTDST